MGENHSHNHSHHDISGKNMGIAILLNIIITVGQVIGGLISGSVALLSDALHNFSDVISLALSYITNRIAKKNPTKKQTFGFKRAEILSAFVNSATLIGVAIFLIVEGIERMANPQPINSDIVIWFALGSIIINFLSVVILHNDSKESLNVKSAYIHLLTDVLTSVAVLAGGVLMKYLGIYSIDSILSIAIAIYLIYASYKMLVDSIKILMQFTPKGIDVDAICNQISEIKLVENIHHVHIWQLTDKEMIFEAHMDLEKDLPISQFQEILQKAEKILYDFGIYHSNIQPEYHRDDDKSQIVVH